MKKAIHYDADDIKKILAARHNVDEKNVIRNQYSYTVVLDEEETMPFDTSDHKTGKG